MRAIWQLELDDLERTPNFWIGFRLGWKPREECILTGVHTERK